MSRASLHPSAPALDSLPTRQGFARCGEGIESYWRLVGPDTGLTPLVCCNGIGVGVSFWDYVLHRFAPHRPVLVWDYRGHGRSTPHHRGMNVTIPQLARDLGRVCEDAGIERAVFLGHSMGSQVVLERNRQAPDQVAGLVSVLGTFGHPLDTFGDLPISRQVFDLLIQTAKSWPRALDWVASGLVAAPWAFDVGKLAKLVDGERIHRADLRRYLHHLASGISFAFFFEMAEQMGEHTARDILPSITAPALVVAGEFDAFTPPRLAQELADGLANAELVMLEGASHAGLIEQPRVMNDAIARFLEERVDA